jgi:hypothetical protein
MTGVSLVVLQLAIFLVGLKQYPGSCVKHFLIVVAMNIVEIGAFYTVIIVYGHFGVLLTRTNHQGNA